MQSRGAESECRVFALIIGIDQYKVIRSLNGCVNDANGFKDFLTDSLHVPESHIKLLTNEAATRANILSAFKTHLIENRRIRDGEEDTIIIFYAGHGSRVKAPDNMFSPDGLVETICPHDERGMDENGGHIHGIPDYTIHALLQTLAAAKGNNLTAIFDSCNAGGIGRSDNTPRYVETTVPIPADLDNNVLRGRAGKSSIPKGFRYQFMESHILLAACRDNQIAFETTSEQGVCRGRFSESLLRTLSRLTLEKTTYTDLMDDIGSWVDQNPQVEGTHKKRLLFNGTYPPMSKQALPLTRTNKPECFEIKMGSLEGVVTGTEFLVNDANNTTVGFLSAITVDFYRSYLGPKDKKTVLELPLGSKASVSDWKNPDLIMQVFIAPDFNPAAASGIFPQQNLDTFQLKTLPIPRRFVRAESREKADIELKRLTNDNFAIERLRGIIKDHTHPAIEFSLNPDKYHRLPLIMDGIAHFQYFLKIHHGGTPIPGVTLEMHTLTGAFPHRIPSPDIFVDKVAQIKYDKEAKYGFTICNRSSHHLFPYLFYFDPEKYAIDVWYYPPAANMTPPLFASPDGGKEATKFPVGYGVGGYAFEFDLPPGKTVDTGFLKVLVSTEYLDMKWIAQISPFHPDFTPSIRGWGRETIEKEQAWDAFHAVITMTEW